MTAAYLSRRGLGSPGVAPCNSTARNTLLSARKHACPVILASGAQVPGLPGSSIVPQPSAGRTAGVKSPQRTFSVMQSAMKIPGLASALHLIGVNGGHDSTGNGSPATFMSTVAAAGNNGAGTFPEEAQPPSLAPPLQQNPAEAAATAADLSEAAVYEMAAAATAVHGNGNGLSHSHHQPFHTSQAGGVVANGRSKGGSDSQRRGEDGLSIADPVAGRVENNIAPYSLGMPSLAVQIRDIASTLRHINALRVEYVEKISQQELELATKDRALRSREERIQELEHEKADLQRSLALLHGAKAAMEAEVQRLRAVAAAAPAPALPAAPAPTTSAATQQPPAPAEPPGGATPAPAPAAAPPAVEAAEAAPLHPLTAPPAAVVASAPATATPSAPAASPSPSPPPSLPTPPPPPTLRVPEVVLSYRSSWPEAFLHINIDGKGWTEPPGMRMEHAGSKEYTVKLQACSVEFVLTNGQGEWDGPGGSPGRNYRIDSPGEYRLHYGTLTQTKASQP